MKLPSRLSEAHVAILGLGLMGGSLAMALKGTCARLLGCDPDPKALPLARSEGLVDLASDDLQLILPQANLLILAAPVCAILGLLARIPELHPGSAIVMDLGSTKAEIIGAMDRLPDTFQPIGGHPICGKETSSIRHADAAMFRDAPFALTRLDRTSEATCRLAEEIVQVIGSTPLWLDAETHDKWAAAISQLPYLMAAALVLVTAQETTTLAGPGFRSASRLAGSSTHMMLDVLSTNGDAVAKALKGYRMQIQEIEDCLTGKDTPALKRKLEQARQRHERLNAPPPSSGVR